MTAIIIQARMASIRLPGKIMKKLAGRPVLWHVVERCRKSKKADQVIVATTTNSEDDLVEKWCLENKIPYYRGSSDNVLERYYQTAKKYGADVIVRITSDCSLIDPKIIDVCLEAFGRNQFDYLSNVVPPPRTFPLGLEVEVFSFAALKKAYLEAKENYEKEHVTPYIWGNKKGDFRIGLTILASEDYRRAYRLTMDYPEDFELLEKIYAEFYKSGSIINVPEVLKFLDEHPELAKINANCVQKPVK